MAGFVGPGKELGRERRWPILHQIREAERILAFLGTLPQAAPLETDGPGDDAASQSLKVCRAPCWKLVFRPMRE
ncbi:hypothetical protein E4U35_003897 [Claviceps purpurea]|nr:hypothetical protein E4U35_003897 [Claviceps purpurea]